MDTPMPSPKVVRLGLALGLVAVAGTFVTPFLTYSGQTPTEVALALTAATGVAGLVVNVAALRSEPGWWKRSTVGVLLSIVPALAALAFALVLSSGGISTF